MDAELQWINLQVTVQNQDDVIALKSCIFLTSNGTTNPITYKQFRGVFPTTSERNFNE